MTSMHLDVALRAYAPSWEHVGAALPEAITATNISAARKATGLDWEVAVEPQFRRVHVGGSDLEPLYDYVEPKTPAGKQQFKYITRGVGGPILDSADGTYHLFTNAEVFATAEAICLAAVELGRDVKFVAGGDVAGGKRIFLMADLGVREIPGDPSPHVKYLGMVSSHDSSAALKCIGTDLRWFCTNAIHASEVDAKAKGTAFSFRHTSRIGQRVEAAKDAIIATMVQLDTVDRATERMLAKKVTGAQMSEYISQYALARVIGKSTANPDKAEGSRQRVDALQFVTANITDILDSRTCEGIAGTAYGAFAATVEFLDHKRPAPGGKDALFNRTMVDTQRDKILARQVLNQVLGTQF